ncbi:MAG TPA: hypothetical protein PKA63_04365 [Oligoflexia bacterium]|nr:hypothetical protein [Oligoflexia bacterium]HMP47884.1 hypothetical protein [Oligoflexia bacterium]
MSKTINKLILQIVLLSVLLILITPLDPALPGNGLEASWMYFLGHAFFNNLQHGKEIIFTYGPYGPFNYPGIIYTGNHVLYSAQLAVSIVLAGLISFSLSRILENWNLLASLSLVSLISVSLYFGGGLYFIFPLLLIVLCGSHSVGFVVQIMIIFVLAFSSLIKTSYAPISLVTCVSLDLLFYFDRTRRVPIFTILYLLSFIVLWFIAGQEIINIPAFLKGTAEISAGYASSMAISGDAKEIFVFIFFVLIFVFVFFRYLYIKEFSISSYTKTILSFIPFVILLFFSFKLGFVRHDSHATTAFSVLVIASALYLSLLFNSGVRDNLIFTLLIFIIFGGTIFMFRNINNYRNITYPQLVLEEKAAVKARLNAIKLILGGEHLKVLDIKFKDAVKTIRSENTINHLDGSVDIYPWDSSILLAYAENYSSRPVFQSYVSYSPYLLKKNRDHLTSDRSPDYIWFSVGDIDGRLPSGMDAYSWPDFLKFYCPLRFQRNFILFRKCNEARTLSLYKIKEIEVPISDSVVLPESNFPLWAEINLKESLIGQVVSFLFRTAEVYINFNLESGDTRKYKIVPGIVSKGFVLTPLVENNFDLYALDYTDRVTSKSVKSISIDVHPEWAKWVYRDSVSISLSEMRFSSGYEWNKVENFNNLHKMLSNGVFHHPPEIKRYKEREILFSHLPSKTFLHLDKQDLLGFSFGFYEEAYTNGGKTAGGCFQVFLDNEKLWERCLDPYNLESDRGTKSVEIPLPEKGGQTLTFEIIPLESGNSNWGWTYWSDVCLDNRNK